MHKNEDEGRLKLKRRGQAEHAVHANEVAAFVGEMLCIAPSFCVMQDFQSFSSFL